MTVLKLVLCVIIGYALGNISTGILIGRTFGIKDVREAGSGSSGSTNVIRSLGLLPGILTVAGDFMKGFAAAFIGQAMCGTVGLLAGGIAAVVGHDFPALFDFRGGKGIVTSLGVIAVIEPWLAPALFGLQLAVAITTRYMSVGALTDMTAFPIVIALFYRERPDFWLLLTGAVVIAALAFFQHRGNIRRLIRGQERCFEVREILKRKPRF